jgi:hypothetical protein
MCCLHHQGWSHPSSLMMEAACTSETSVDNYFTRQYIPEDNSELHTHRRENLKSHITTIYFTHSKDTWFIVHFVNLIFWTWVQISVTLQWLTEEPCMFRYRVNEINTIASAVYQQSTGMMVLMSMGWDYVSELRPPTGLLFIHQVIHEHGEWWWNDVDRGKLKIRPTEFSGNPTKRVLVASRRNGRREWWIWPCQVFPFILASNVLHSVKSYDMETPPLHPLRRKACCGF